MRILLPLIPMASLVACTETESSAVLHARQEAACTAVIAEHVRRPSAEVTSHWFSQAGGVAKVEAFDDDRRHICDVDVSGKVIGYSHPETET